MFRWSGAPGWAWIAVLCSSDCITICETLDNGGILGPFFSVAMAACLTKGSGTNVRYCPDLKDEDL